MRAESRKAAAFYTQLCILCLLSLGVAAISVRQLLLTTRNYDILYLAEAIETSDRISAKSVTAFSDRFLRSASAGTCRSDIVRSATTVVLRSIDFHDPAGDYDGWARAVSDGEGYLRHALGCLPADGNIWLRLAMLKGMGGEQPAQIAFLMNHSQWLSPAEKVLIAARFEMWNRLSEQTLRLASDAVASDIREHDRYWKGYPSPGQTAPSPELVALFQTEE